MIIKKLQAGEGVNVEESINALFEKRINYIDELV